MCIFIFQQCQYTKFVRLNTWCIWVIFCSRKKTSYDSICLCRNLLSVYDVSSESICLSPNLCFCQQTLSAKVISWHDSYFLAERQYSHVYWLQAGLEIVPWAWIPGWPLVGCPTEPLPWTIRRHMPHPLILTFTQIILQILHFSLYKNCKLYLKIKKKIWNI